MVSELRPVLLRAYPDAFTQQGSGVETLFLHQLVQPNPSPWARHEQPVPTRQNVPKGECLCFFCRRLQELRLESTQPLSGARGKTLKVWRSPEARTWLKGRLPEGQGSFTQEHALESLYVLAGSA